MMTMRIEANWESGNTQTNIRAGMHKFVSDKAASAGGGDKGPNPMQYLLAGLGGCLISVGKRVAQEQGLSPTAITCRVDGDIDPAVRPGCKEIRATLTVAGVDDAAALGAWLEEVERQCPVRDCIVNATPVLAGFKK